MKCIHCSKNIPPTADIFVYPRSQAIAHVGCVSLPSVAATDAYILQRREQNARSNTRRVYSTGTTARRPA